MSNKELEVLKHSVEGATAGLLKPIHDLVAKLAGPAAEELGLAWQDHIRVWRYSRATRLARKVQELLDSKDCETWQAVPLKVLLPSLEHASLEDDDNLQDHWATLLANAADPKYQSERVPVFVEILKQLSSTDAHLLESVYNDFREYGGDDLDHEVGGFDDLREMLEKVYDNLGGPPPSDVRTDLRLSLENLIRLGLITRKEGTKKTGFLSFSFLDQEEGKKVIQNLYYLTSLGKAFLASCQPQKSL